MGKKRKSNASLLDEVDRGMYSIFCSAANSLSQLYTHAMHQQPLSFHAGERHALEKLRCWHLRQQEDGIRVTTGDIIAYIQNELDYGPEEPPSPRQQLPQTLMQLPNSGLTTPLNASGITAAGQGMRATNSDQSRNTVFSNALSSPVRRSLQHYHLSQEGYSAPSATRGNENTAAHTRAANPPSLNDTSMDHDSPY